MGFFFLFLWCVMQTASGMPGPHVECVHLSRCLQIKQTHQHIEIERRTVYFRCDYFFYRKKKMETFAMPLIVFTLQLCSKITIFFFVIIYELHFVIDVLFKHGCQFNFMVSYCEIRAVPKKKYFLSPHGMSLELKPTKWPTNDTKELRWNEMYRFSFVARTEVNN